MMWTGRRRQEALSRATERRAREDNSPRLREEIPMLDSMEIEVVESRAGAPEIAHIRKVVVEHAPALFDIACGDRKCVGGGHDVTAPILSALKRGEKRFDGEHVCDGTLGNEACGRRLRFNVQATFR